MAARKSASAQPSASSLKDAVNQAMLEDVAPVVEEILRRHIQTDIYDVYTPKEGAWIGGETYERSHLMEDNLTSYVIDGDTLFTTAMTTADDPIVQGYEFSSNYPGAFLEMLANGNMGIWKSGFPRPAVENAQAEVDNSSAVRQAVNRSVKRALEQNG